MSDTLTRQGARNLTRTLDRVAEIVQNRYTLLGLPGDVALDFAKRADLISDAVELTASALNPLDNQTVRRATRGFYVALRDLPPFLVKILAQEGEYKNRDIEVIPATSVEVGFSPFGGNRAYAVIVNLDTHRYKTLLGDWSGGQGTNPLDRGGMVNIPPNAAVIYGEYGGRGSFAHIAINPDNVAALVEQDEGTSLSEDEKYALTFINSFNTQGRRDAFWQKHLGTYNTSNPLVQSLTHKGLLKIQGRGVRITTKGKNTCKSLGRKYENPW